jgi:hypothetical protein
MQLAKSIKLKSSVCFRFIPFLFVIVISLTASAQDNSPYSRYGLGDQVSKSNVVTRGMGGLSAGYADIYSINFSNPASYSQFQTFAEQRSKKISAGRVIFDAGLDIQNRRLIEPNTPNRFTSSDVYFSYLTVGLPISKNWGMSFGIRPLTRVSYLMNSYERLKDPVTGKPIDSAVTQAEGSGGTYLPSIGTGFAIKNFSAGFNIGYIFGNRENKRLRSLINDTVLYYSSAHFNNYSFGGLYADVGVQYKINLNKTTFLRLGVSGNWEQKINGSQDALVQTFTRGSAGEELQIDSVFKTADSKGKVIYPASYKTGFVIQRIKVDGSGWLVGADYTQNKWSDFRFFGQEDSVQDNWSVNVGGQIIPRPRTNYFSRVVYRFGFYSGPDYIKVHGDLPQYGVTFGMALPIGNYNRQNPYSVSVLNLALDYGKRGNNDNILKENIFRVSIGLNFTDLWFGKKKYD